MQQQQQGQGTPSDENQQSPSPAERGDNDDTWGLGSASAMDSLRRQNFRGRRSPKIEERPAAD